MEDLGKNPAGGGGGGRGVLEWVTVYMRGPWDTYVSYKMIYSIRMGNRVPANAGERTKPMRVVFKQTTGIKYDDMMDMNQSEFSSI